MSYLNDIPMLIKSKCTATTVAEFLTFGNLTRTLATRAAYYVHKTNKALKSSTASIKLQQNDLFAVQIQRMVKVHIQYLMFLMSVEMVEKHQFKD